jgi:hypothetical protein
MRMRALGPMVLVGGLVALSLAASVTPALAWWRGGVFVSPGVVVGPPVVVAPPVYVPSYPAPVVVEPPAPTYQQQQPQTAQQYWYYCQDPQGYYPYVQQCPRGWQPVSPTPQAGQ